MDIAKPMIAEASERGVDILVRGDSCFLPFKDNVFDAAVCIYLLHLISEWKTALWEICRVTRKAMVTIIYVGERSILEAYNPLLKDYGYESRRLGKGK